MFADKFRCSCHSLSHQENTLTVAVREEDIGLQKEACPICLECFQVGDKVRRLPCMHLFHVVGGESSSSQGRHCNIDRPTQQYDLWTMYSYHAEFARASLKTSDMQECSKIGKPLSP
ncbi:rnf126-b [Symbiodinium natans]|uniref:Rnf126-b protein n=1 Tax=Symbiodinium natans TaxID=878477 RepID=A0A812UVL2_9DINO|nr:rnf126-b [Symbiodinium natans]